MWHLRVLMTKCVFSLDNDKKPTAPPKKPSAGKRHPTVPPVGPESWSRRVGSGALEAHWFPFGPMASLQKPGLRFLGDAWGRWDGLSGRVRSD